MTKFQYHEDGTLPTGDVIFVFGSNHAGRHGAGAAKVAYDKFGAKMGQGHGFSGKSFAIPTKNTAVVTLPLYVIKSNVETFIRFTHLLKSRHFFVTRIGCELAGYKNSEIAPFFKNAYPNCNMPVEWAEFLEDDPLPEGENDARDNYKSD